MRLLEHPGSRRRGLDKKGAHWHTHAMETHALDRLRTFRRQIYTTFGCYCDALVEILDALLTTSVIEHPVHLSLAPGFQRTWGSVYDALNVGTMPLARLEHLAAEVPLVTSTAWYAVDTSVCPRCDAVTSSDRGYYHHHSRHSKGQPLRHVRATPGALLSLSLLVGRGRSLGTGDPSWPDALPGWDTVPLPGSRANLALEFLGERRWPRTPPSQPRP